MNKSEKTHTHPDFFRKNKSTNELLSEEKKYTARYTLIHTYTYTHQLKIK